MQIVLDLDPLIANRLTFLMLRHESGKWVSERDIIAPLINAEYLRVNIPQTPTDN